MKNQWRDFTDDELIGAMESESSCDHESLPGLRESSLVALIEEVRLRDLDESAFTHWTRHWEDQFAAA